jgi:hypothetical protein
MTAHMQSLMGEAIPGVTHPWLYYFAGGGTSRAVHVEDAILDTIHVVRETCPPGTKEVCPSHWLARGSPLRFGACGQTTR